MPGYQEHLSIGFATAGILVIIFQFIFHINLIEVNILTTLVIVTLLFSLLPDIDHKSSKISMFLHLISLLAILALITQIIEINFSSLLILITIASLEIYHWSYAKADETHRHFSHSFTFGLLALVVLFLITFSWIAILMGAITFISHIVIDGFFVKAIEQDKLFWKLIISKIIKN